MLTHDLESARKSLSERDGELVRCKRRNAELEWRERDQQSHISELQRSLAKSRSAKNEELSSMKHRMETVLEDREQQVTAYEQHVEQTQNELQLSRQLVQRLRPTFDQFS